jgi:hypothetical protein
MLGRIKDLDKKFTGVIKENFTFSQSTLTEITSVKSDKVTFLFKRHDPEILQSIHGKVVSLIYTKKRAMVIGRFKGLLNAVFSMFFPQSFPELDFIFSKTITT